LLSDHLFHFFGRTITITSQEQILAIVFLVVAATTWGVLQFRRRRSVVVHRSAVSDQVVYELSRIADALDRIANRPVDQVISGVGAGYKEDEHRTMPFSMFGRER
jgi:hypothetical protein